MKVSKAGIKMYEASDEVNDTGDAINKLRMEVNKIAVAIDAVIDDTGADRVVIREKVKAFCEEQKKKEGCWAK